MVTNNWVGAFIGAAIALLVAILVPPYVPAPGGMIISVLGYVVAVVLFIVGLLALLRGRGV